MKRVIVHRDLITYVEDRTSDNPDCLPYLIAFQLNKAGLMGKADRYDLNDATEIIRTMMVAMRAKVA